MFALNRIMLSAVSAAIVSTWPPVRAQSASDNLDRVTHGASFTFLERDGTCAHGIISHASANAITVKRFGQPPLTLARGTLLQVGEGDALLFSARSSWADVSKVKVYPRETLIVMLRNGKRITGTLVKVTPDSITLKHGFQTTSLVKAAIATVDYLRTRPATDNFDFVLEEAPYALFLYPEFYQRLAGLEGRIAVRLYDTSKPEDDSPGVARCFR